MILNNTQTLSSKNSIDIGVRMAQDGRLHYFKGGSAHCLQLHVMANAGALVPQIPGRRQHWEVPGSLLRRPCTARWAG